MLLFRSDEHIDNWCAMWGQPRGGTLSLQQGWALAQEWYGADRRDPSWQRKTADEAQALFSGLGLVSDFWRLAP